VHLSARVGPLVLPVATVMVVGTLVLVLASMAVTIVLFVFPHWVAFCGQPTIAISDLLFMLYPRSCWALISIVPVFGVPVANTVNFL